MFSCAYDRFKQPNALQHFHKLFGTLYMQHLAGEANVASLHICTSPGAIQLNAAHFIQYTVETSGHFVTYDFATIPPVTTYGTEMSRCAHVACRPLRELKK